MGAQSSKGSSEQAKKKLVTTKGVEAAAADQPATMDPRQLITVKLIEDHLEFLPDQARDLLAKLNKEGVGIRTLSDFKAAAESGFEYDEVNKRWNAIGLLGDAKIEGVEVIKLRSFFEQGMFHSSFACKLIF